MSHTYEPSSEPLHIIIGGTPSSRSFRHRRKGRLARPTRWATRGLFPSISRGNWSHFIIFGVHLFQGLFGIGGGVDGHGSLLLTVSCVPCWRIHIHGTHQTVKPDFGLGFQVQVLIFFTFRKKCIFFKAFSASAEE